MLTQPPIEESTPASVRLAAQSQKIARFGSWEWVAGADKMLWTSELFDMLEMQCPDDNIIDVQDASLFLHFSDIDKITNIPKGSLQSEVAELSYKWTTTTGRTLDIYCWCQASKDNITGQVILQGVCQDISAFNRIKEQETLERQNDMLQQAEETAKIGSWKYNFATKQVNYSDSLFHLLGYSERAFENDVEKVFAHVAPEDVPRVYDTYRQTIADGIRRCVDFKVTRTDGELRYFTSNGSMSKNKKGEPIIVGTVQDITEQHLLARTLEEQTDFVQKLVDSSVNCVSVIDHEMKYVLWNSRCEELYKRSKEDVIGKNIREVFSDIDITWFAVAAERAIQGERVKVEDWVSVVTGRHHEMHMIPLRNSENEVTHIFILVHDVTELMQLNEALTQEKEFAEAMIDHSESCIFVFDSDLRYLAWNKKCEEFYNIPKSEVIGKTLSEVFTGVDMTVPLSRLKKALQGETVHYAAESSFVIDRFYDSYVIPMKTVNGEVKSILCLLNDVTDIVRISQRAKEANRLLEEKNHELLKQKAFLETLVDNSPDAIAAWDRDMNIIAYNKQSEARYGKLKEEVLGRHVLDAFPEIRDNSYMDNLAKALSGIPVHIPEERDALGTGYNENYLVPMTTEEGEILGALGIIHDITAVRRSKQQLEELNNKLASKNDELYRINSELASFSYVASHDLQEPLRKIQAFTSLILAKDFPNISESGKDYFQRIQASANRMQQMIDGLLSFSRTNTTSKVLEEKDLSEVMDKILFNLQQEIRSKEATVNFDKLSSLPIIPHQFEQMLEHIIGNALKFQPEGNKPQVTVNGTFVNGAEIKGEVAEKNRQYYRISVIDNGIGFDAEDAEKIFQMFHRLNGKSAYPGTGIGLAICRRIAQNHNGFITTESSPGNGAAFHIHVPVSQ